mgnify:CR=1 FL=1
MPTKKPAQTKPARALAPLRAVASAKADKRPKVGSELARASAKQSKRKPVTYPAHADRNPVGAVAPNGPARALEGQRPYPGTTLYPEFNPTAALAP